MKPTSPVHSGRAVRVVAAFAALLACLVLAAFGWVSAATARADIVLQAVGSITCDTWEKAQGYASVDELLSEASELGNDSAVSSVTIDMYCDWNTHDYGRIVVPKGKSYTLNMHGHVLDAHKAGTYGDDNPWYAEGKGEAVHVEEGGALTVNGGTGEEAQIAHAGTLVDVYTDSDGNVTSAFWKFDGLGQTVLNGGVITGGACDDRYGSGGISAEGAGCKVYLNDVTVAGNLTDRFDSSYGHGAGVAIHGKDSTLELNNAHIVYNHAEGTGGGLYVRSSGCTVTLKNGSEVSHNLAIYDGGGIFIEGNDSELSLVGCTISYNETHKNGGGLYHNGKRGSVSLTEGASIRSNHADGDGGGVYGNYDGTEFTLDASEVACNLAGEIGGTDQRGGGMYLMDESTLTLDHGSKIRGNYAGAMGGGLVLFDPSTVVLRDSSSVCENSACSGGGINCISSPTVELIDSTICDNEARTANGGGLYIQSNTQVILHGSSSICRNKAAGNGGGIYASLSKSDRPTVRSDSQATICDNECAGFGGGVYTQASGTYVGLTIANNSAKCGGGIWGNSEFYVRDTIIQGNTATQKAGGVWLSGTDSYWLGKMVVGGKVVLDGNTVNGVTSNLSYELMSGNNPLGCESAYPLSKDSHIGTATNTYDLVDEFELADDSPLLDEIGDSYSTCFFADNPCYSITRKSSGLYIVKSNSSFDLTVYGASSDTPAISGQAEYASTITLNGSDYLKDGCAPAYWEVMEGLGAVTRLEPSDGVATFNMPGNAVALRAVYQPVLTGISVDLRDASSSWDALGSEASLVSVAGLSLTDNRGVTYQLGAEAADVARVTGCEQLEALGTEMKTIAYEVEVDASLFETYDLYVRTSSQVSGSSTVRLMGTTAAGSDVTCSASAGLSGLDAKVTATFSRYDAEHRVGRVNIYDANAIDGSDPMAVVDKLFDYGVEAAVTVPEVTGWQFVSWTSLPEGATEDSQTHAVTLPADADGVELAASYEPLLTRLDLTIVDPSETLEQFPTQVESYTPHEASGADLAELCDTWETSVEWSRADGADLTEPQVLPGVTYVALAKVHVSAPLDHRFGLAEGVYVTVNGSAADSVQVEGGNGEWVVSATYSITTAPDASLFEVLTDLSDVAIVDATELTSWLPAQVAYLTRDGRTLRADVAWDLSGVDVDRLDEGVTVPGTFTDGAGGTQQVSRSFTLADLGLPQASEPAGRVEIGTSVTLGAGQGWEGYAGAQLYYYVLPAGSSVAPEDVDRAEFAPYTAPIQVGSDCTLLAFAQVGGRQTSLAQWSFRACAVSGVSVTGGRALDADGKEAARAFEGDEVRLVADEPGEGQEFAGWEVTLGDARLVDAGAMETTFAMPAGEVAVRATYKAIEYAVTFDAAGGAPAPAAQSVAWGTCAEEPEAPVLAGKTFLGWFADGASTAWDFKTPVTSAIKLTARWQAVTLSVTFDVAGGSPAPEAQSVTWGICAKEPPVPSLAGHTFLGWYVEDSASAWDFKTPVTSTLKLTAKWEPVELSVTFDAAGGTPAPEAQSVAYGSCAQQPSTPSREGYTFLGWFAEGSGTAWDFGTPVASALTLTAKWQATPPTSFIDVPEGAWYHDWVYLACERGLMMGYQDGADGPFTGCFGPEDAITRGQVATVLWRMAGEPEAQKAAPFPEGDVVPGKYYAEAVAWCYERGIVTGYESGPNRGLFLPDAGVSREELALMVTRFERWAGLDTSGAPAANFERCTDNALVSSWAVEAVTWTAASGVLGGKEIPGESGATTYRLDPQQGATRAQAAKVFARAWEIKHGEEPYEGQQAGEASQATDAPAQPAADTAAQEATFDDVTFDDVAVASAQASEDTMAESATEEGRPAGESQASGAAQPSAASSEDAPQPEFDAEPSADASSDSLAEDATYEQAA